MKKFERKRNTSKIKEKVRTSKNALSLKKRNKEMPVIVGRVEVSAKRGDYAFLVVKDAENERPYIAKRDFNGAMHGDLVEAALISNNKGAGEVSVTKIIERGVSKVVGIYFYNDYGGFVEPDDIRFPREIFIDIKELPNEVMNLDKVVVAIDFADSDKYKAKTGRDRKVLKGKIIEVLGAYDDRGVDILSIIRAHNLYEEFPKAVLTEANTVAVEPSVDDIKKRSDFRNDLIFTIDGDDSKDFDDAVAVEILDNGNYKLSVHIADVSHYVRALSKLDKEAFKRGTSVYFVDRVLPMLPEVLSNNICSLNEGVDRLVLSCIMEIDNNGGVVGYEIVEGVIRSSARTTYSLVSKILDNELEIRNEKLEIKDKYERLLPTLKIMQHLAEILNKKRMARGNIDFDVPECNIILDDNGRAIDIQKKPRLVAHKIIEEFMLAANETVAKFLGKIEAPGVFRVHDAPPADKYDAFKDFLKALAVEFELSDKPKSKEFQELLEIVKGNQRELAVTKTALRAMAKADYQAEDKGHFGLASDNYCHFTSPIRRYPDLVVHRVVKEFLNYGSEALRVRFMEFCVKASSNSSERERLAEKAEREVNDLKKAEFMSDKIGQSFEGIISGVTERGIFVELENTVEGMIKLENLPGDNYEFIERQLLIKNKANSFRIGDLLEIVVSGVARNKIEFELSK
ncbi:MAG: ribonuclease R [Firmicutes bacterium]|nr:ribonuclease R [Bacillota bacterium]